MPPTTVGLADLPARAVTFDYRQGAFLGHRSEVTALIADLLLTTAVASGRQRLGTPPWQRRTMHQDLLSTESTWRSVCSRSARAYGQDLDPIHFGGGHSVALLLPALLTLFEAGDTDASGVIDGYLAGLEVIATLTERSGQALRHAGYHPSTTLGPIALSVAICKAMGTGPEVAVTAADLAVRGPSGRESALRARARDRQLIGSIARGLEAALTAMNGGQSNVPPWQTVLAPFLHGLGQRTQREAFRPLAIAECSHYIKLYPACGFLLVILDAMTQVGALPGGKTMPFRLVIPPEFGLVASQAFPQNLTEARYSLRYALALLSVDGTLQFGYFHRARLSGNDVREAFKDIEVGVDEHAPRRGYKADHILTVFPSDSGDGTHVPVPSFRAAGGLWDRLRQKCRSTGRERLAGRLHDLQQFEQWDVRHWNDFLEEGSAA